MRRGRNRRKNVGSVCLRSMFSQPVATGSFSASCQEESEDKELQSSEGSCILHLGTELCRVLSFSAWICGRSSSPLLCLLNVVGDDFNAFHQTFGGFYFSDKRAHGGCYMLSKSYAVSSAVCVSSMLQNPPQSDCRSGKSFLVTLGKSSTSHNGLDRLDRMQVKGAPVPAPQLNHALQVPLQEGRAGLAQNPLLSGVLMDFIC